MEINLAKLENLAHKLTAMHAGDGVQSLDAEDRRTIMEASEVMDVIVTKMRKIEKQHEELRHAVVTIICEALTGKDIRCGCDVCRVNRDHPEETTARE